jgi:hypothetical protein
VLVGFAPVRCHADDAGTLSGRASRSRTPVGRRPHAQGGEAPSVFHNDKRLLYVVIFTMIFATVILGMYSS